ncbi:uncharacterized protein M6B38_409635 [Iris pallida]|uniref:(S)-ureidoglycine aminohydrolase cupin domain-containing protein n=1 Tax=Iris pallida TaxID=29817 RepID=A0AAX6FPM3_IRIPA|nr:uncharacterized protein M6B38_409635 [Iris pallida]
MASPCMIASHLNTFGCFSSNSTGLIYSTPPSPPTHLKRTRGPGFAVRGEAMAIEKLGIKVERNPPESKLQDLGVRTWPKWGCPPSKFPWTYTAKEKCYLLEGEVKVFPEGHGNEFVQIRAGDFVEFPKGMSCTWDVSVAVDKHYMFE